MIQRQFRFHSPQTPCQTAQLQLASIQPQIMRLNSVPLKGTLKEIYSLIIVYYPLFDNSFFAEIFLPEHRKIQPRRILSRKLDLLCSLFICHPS